MGVVVFMGVVLVMADQEEIFRFFDWGVACLWPPCQNNREAHFNNEKPRAGNARFSSF
jgi:hypothetical protein